MIGGWDVVIPHNVNADVALRLVERYFEHLWPDCVIMPDPDMRGCVFIHEDIHAYHHVEDDGVEEGTHGFAHVLGSEGQITVVLDKKDAWGLERERDIRGLLVANHSAF